MDPNTTQNIQSKIRHTQGFGQPMGAKPAPPVDEADDGSAGAATATGDGAADRAAYDPASERKEIRTFGGSRPRHEDSWTRTPNTTGQGAIHVKTFHGKLTEDALHYMDQLINEWLDAHPQYEVKFVTTSIGLFTGKIKEPHVVCQVWV